MVCFPFIKLNYGKQLSFSKEPGYYDTPFYLSILGGKGGTIHYTLDGSEPTVDDPVFDRKDPLYIEDVTNQPNVYSMRTDTSTGFLTGLTNQMPWVLWYIPNYKAPRYPVDKCTVIRASVFDSAGSCLDSITGTYFVGFQDKDTYQNIYTLSVVTSPENLFNKSRGIYVKGNAFDQAFGDSTKSLDQIFLLSGNYINDGPEWEREAFITLFSPQKNCVLSSKCGIRIKGHLSRVMLPKSISCYAREIYSGSNNFDTDIFKTGILPHKIIIFAGGNDNQFKLKDYLANTLESNLSFATMDFFPCAMFLDGEYWGMYYVTEDYNTDYIHDHYQVSRDNVILVKDNVLTEGIEDDISLYKEMRSFIEENDMTNMANYNQACNLLDMDSYIDYYASQIYIARAMDWPGGNFALWRTRKNDGSFYGDGKWRWMLFDVNSAGMSGNYLTHNTLSHVLSHDSMFFSLYQNEDFRRQFAERLLYIGNETFAPEKCNLFIDQYVQTMKEPLAASNMRFYMDDKSEEFEQYVTDMRTFFDGRYDVVWNFLVDNMGEEWLTQNGIKK